MYIHDIFLKMYALHLRRIDSENLLSSFFFEDSTIIS